MRKVLAACDPPGLRGAAFQRGGPLCQLQEVPPGTPWSVGVPSAGLAVSVVLVMATLLAVKWNLSAVSICTSLMTNYTDHLFINLWAFCKYLK